MVASKRVIVFTDGLMRGKADNGEHRQTFFSWNDKLVLAGILQIAGL